MRRFVVQAVLSACLSTPSLAHGQEPPGFVRIGGIDEDRQRVEALLGTDSTTVPLLRTAEVLSGPLARPRSIRLVAPDLLLAYDSDLPFSLNEDGRWAGRGAGIAVTGGVRARWGALHLTLSPVAEHAANRDFETPIGAGESPSAFIPPWRRGRYSADLPVRYGSAAVTRFGPGASTLELRGGAVGVGLSSAPRWWGPALRNAIVLSNHASGFPHVYVGTPGPVALGPGRVEAVLLTGALTESPFFDLQVSNDRRSLSAAAGVYHFRGSASTSVGVARAVVSSGGSRRSLVSVLDPTPRADTAAGLARAAVQVASIFARWASPGDGLEVYGEWARHELPQSLRALAVSPGHTRGYTVGLQWAREISAMTALRLQAEATNLEQSSTYRSAPRPSFYTSPSVPQGYTHRGRVLGAAIGPGASSQWLGLDAIGRSWGAGLGLERIRWDNDAFYTTSFGRNYHAHDVSLIMGARGHLRTGIGTVSMQLQREARHNLFFQNPTFWPGGADAVDARNLSFRMGISTRL